MFVDKSMDFITLNEGGDANDFFKHIAPPEHL